MVFRRDNKSGDAFQRQMSALRQQLGESQSDDAAADAPEEQAAPYGGYDDPSSAVVQRGGGFSEALARAGDYRSYDTYDTSEEEMRGYSGQAVTGSVVPTAPELPSVPEVDASTTVIAFNTTWKGEFTSQGTVHVHGVFDGAITASDEIVIGEQATVDAKLNAATVIVAGNVKGTIRCEGRFEVLPTGRVTGDVQSPTLVIHEGAVVAGQVRMDMSEPTAEPAPRVETPVPVIQRRANRGSA